MSDFELKPCPFCGAIPKLYRQFYQTQYFHYQYIVECLDDDCLVKPKVVYDEECDAIEAWNTRAEKTCVMKSIKNGAVYDVFQCTNCGTEFAERNSEVYIDYKFCPVCGAKVVE